MVDYRSQSYGKYSSSGGKSTTSSSDDSNSSKKKTSSSSSSRSSSSSGSSNSFRSTDTSQGQSTQQGYTDSSGNIIATKEEVQQGLNEGKSPDQIRQEAEQRENQRRSSGGGGSSSSSKQPTQPTPQDPSQPAEVKPYHVIKDPQGNVKQSFATKEEYQKYRVDQAQKKAISEGKGYIEVGGRYVTPGSATYLKDPHTRQAVDRAVTQKNIKDIKEYAAKRGIKPKEIVTLEDGKKVVTQVYTDKSGREIGRISMTYRTIKQEQEKSSTQYLVYDREQQKTRLATPDEILKSGTGQPQSQEWWVAKEQIEKELIERSVSKPTVQSRSTKDPDKFGAGEMRATTELGVTKSRTLGEKIDDALITFAWKNQNNVVGKALMYANKVGNQFVNIGTTFPKLINQGQPLRAGWSVLTDPTRAIVSNIQVGEKNLPGATLEFARTQIKQDEEAQANLESSFSNLRNRFFLKGSDQKENPDDYKPANQISTEGGSSSNSFQHNEEKEPLLNKYFGKEFEIAQNLGRAAIAGTEKAVEIVSSPEAKDFTVATAKRGKELVEAFGAQMISFTANYPVETALVYTLGGVTTSLGGNILNTVVKSETVKTVVTFGAATAANVGFAFVESAQYEDPVAKRTAFSRDLVGGYVLEYGSGLLAKASDLLPKVRIEKLELPSENGGKEILYRGLTVSWGSRGQPLVGITNVDDATGLPIKAIDRIRVGTPDVDMYDIDFSKRINPDVSVRTPAQTKILRSNLAQRYDQQELTKFDLALSLMRSTQNTRSRFIKDVFSREIDSLSPAGVDEVVLFARKQSGTVYGTFSAKPQMPDDLGRVPGDIDIQLDFGAKKTEKKTQQLLGKLEDLGENVRISEKSPTLIESRNAEGEWVSAVDVHSKDDILSFGAEAGKEFSVYGIKGTKPTIKIENVDSMQLSEQGIRKGSAAFGLKEEGFGPKEHRGDKDIADFINTQEALVRSKTFGKQKASEDLEKLKSLYPDDVLKSGDPVTMELTQKKNVADKILSSLSILPSVRAQDVALPASPAVNETQDVEIVSVLPDSSPGKEQPSDPVVIISPVPSPAPSPSPGTSLPSPVIDVSPSLPIPSPSPSIVSSPSASASPSPSPSASPSPSQSPSPSPSPGISPPSPPSSRSVFTIIRFPKTNEKKRTLKVPDFGSKGKYTPSTAAVILGIKTKKKGKKAKLGEITGITIRPVIEEFELVI